MKRHNLFWNMVLWGIALSMFSTGYAADPRFWGGSQSVLSLKNVPESIITRLETGNTAEFFIVLSEQADVSGAKQFKRKEDKGMYVFKQLVDIVERTQPQVIAELGLQDADIRRFHIQNMILVREGLPDMLLAAVNHPMISTIRENRPYIFVNEQPLAYEDNMPGRGPEWNLSHIGITNVWAEGVTGEGIVVANLDTGVQWDHPALKTKYRGWNGTTANHDYNWHDASSYSPSAVPHDSGEHGTHTMGTMVGDDGMGNQIGGAPGAKWMACGPLNDDANYHECFEWFLAPYKFGENPSQGVPGMAPHVVNNSWGWPAGGGDYQYAPDIDALQAAGVFMEFSAGNEGDTCKSLRSPGDYPQVLTTGASDVQNRIVSQNWTYWGSSRGPAKAGIPGTPDFIKPEIVAPGYNVRSCVPGNGYEGGWGGTSMAGPHTCVVVALMWSAAPGLIGDIETTRQIILDNAYTEPGGAGYWNQTCEGINANTTIPNHVWGWGLLDAYACFQALTGVYLDKPEYQLDDTVHITVRDADASGSVEVKVKSTVETSWETVILTQVFDRQFEGSILTTSAPPVQGDGAISVIHGDTLTAWYQGLDVEATAAIDGVSPVISNVQVTEITSKSFTVTWQTDEPSRSIITYGTGTPNIEVLDNTLKIDHILTIISLEPCTYYYFDISAEDRAGNTSVDNNGGRHYGLQTYDITVFMETDMDTDPGWIYEPDWGWGRPTGQGGQYGSPDPSKGYTGNNVVGYNLNGPYPDSMSTTKWVTTQAFDCSGSAVVNLEFYAWLGVEQSWSDHAYIAVSNNNGGSWTTIWENSETLSGGAWELWTFDISNIAAGKSQVKIRWGMGPTDSSWNYCGWNIDDVLVSYEKPCENPTPTPNQCINNGDVDLNGTITSADAQMAFQIALGTFVPTYEEECAADCNGDDTVTSADAQQIFMAALGADSCVDPV